MGKHVHHRDGPTDCYGCKLKGLSVGLPRDFSSRTYSKTPPAESLNSWERGIARDDRGMPYLKPGGAEIGVKEFAENRHSIEETKRALHNGAPLTSTRS